MGTSRPWDDLAGDILTLVAEALEDDIHDILAFRASCKSWREASRNARKGPLSSGTPLLAYINNRDGMVDLYDASRRQKIQNPVYCRGFQRYFSFLGSAHGFVVFMSDRTLVLSNILTGRTIQLPELDRSLTFRSKVILSDSPLKSECLVVYFDQKPFPENHVAGLLYCPANPSDDDEACWRPACPDLAGFYIFDILFVDSELYALVWSSRTEFMLAKIDINAGTSERWSLHDLNIDLQPTQRLNLASAGDTDLLFVQFDRDDHKGMDTIKNIQKWDEDDEEFRPLEDDLDVALFFNAKWYFAKSMAPKNGIQANRVYECRGSSWWWEYSLEEEHGERQNVTADSGGEGTRHFWISPSFATTAEELPAA